MPDNKLVTILTAKDLTEPVFNEAARHAKKYAKVLTATVAVGATAAAVAITKIAKETMAAAQVQIDAEKKLEAVIKATGGAAGYTTAELKKTPVIHHL